MAFEIELSPVQKRIIALLILAAALLPLGFSLASNFSTRSWDHETLSLLESQQAVSVALIEHAPYWADEVNQLNAIASRGKFFFAEGSGAAAADHMRTKFVQIVTAQKAKLLAAEARVETTAASGVNEVRLEATLETDIAGLAHILHDLDEARPFMLATRLAVDGAAIAPDGADAPHRLRVALSLVGYRRTP
jgi:hypothetical protein